MYKEIPAHVPCLVHPQANSKSSEFGLKNTVLIGIMELLTLVGEDANGAVTMQLQLDRECLSPTG